MGNGNVLLFYIPFIIIWPKIFLIFPKISAIFSLNDLIFAVVGDL